VDAVRETTKRVAAGILPYPWQLQNYICDIQVPHGGESPLFVVPSVI